MAGPDQRVRLALHPAVVGEIGIADHRDPQPRRRPIRVALHLRANPPGIVPRWNRGHPRSSLAEPHRAREASSRGPDARSGAAWHRNVAPSRE